MPRGTAKWFNSKKGFGLITTENGAEIFVHFSGINGDGFKALDKGQVVEYEITEGKKGLQAVNVTKVSNGPSSPNSV